uniref:UPAR/Ly6 domain-containing protein n=1 Tax=Panagrolaimus davidi TaxID=227884 RepID=A0A914P0I3_9BILA
MSTVETYGFSYVLPTIQMSCGGGCEKYGRSTKRITVPGFDPVFMHTDEDTYCCDTNLCNTHQNFEK